MLVIPSLNTAAARGRPRTIRMSACPAVLRLRIGPCPPHAKAGPSVPSEPSVALLSGNAPAGGQSHESIHRVWIRVEGAVGIATSRLHGQREAAEVSDGRLRASVAPRARPAR